MDPVQAYRESEAAADNPVRLVLLLYDQMLRDIRRAIDALDRNDVQARCLELDHALIVLSQLQHTLSFDRGGDVAETLDRFYDTMRKNLLLASSQQSRDLLESQYQQILSVRQAWIEVEQRQEPPRAAPAGSSHDGGNTWNV